MGVEFNFKLVDVWEVYEYNSPRCVIFKTKELAENQTEFESTDFICQAKVSLSECEIKDLNSGIPVWA